MPNESNDDRQFIPKPVATAIHAVFIGLVGAMMAWTLNRVFTNSLIITGHEIKMQAIESRLSALEKGK